uniref:FAD-binding PCMH-type domain-containing protein n=1 Tax=Anopheles funestus TaxID=62324 RepID=A0A182R8Q6_ANOFN
TVPVDTSLNTFIRNHAHLTGTKFMCLEGGCGACIVNVNGIHPVTKEKKSWAVNSCLYPVYACHGLDVKTVEGIGNRKDGYHPIQQRLAHLNGTQCGYCSPGMVMNMYSLMEANHGAISMEDVENAFGGNICRCTGYRPILDAFKSLTVDADEKLLDACQDIEDLTKTCPKTGSPCAGKCISAKDRIDPKRPVKLVFEDDKEWHRVMQVADIFAVFEQIGSKPYMLVAGNTAHGVYRRSPSLQAFIDINAVEELHTHSSDNNELVVGANVSLTEFMQILDATANKSPNFSHFKQLEQHIDLIANVPVRSAGTIAGNLSIKNQHHEFPSDMYLLLETAGAKLIVIEAIKLVTPADFVQLDMQKKVLKSITLPALDSSRYKFRSFKVMPRSQNAHAYIDPTEALKLPGVVAFYSAKNIPGANNFMSSGMNFYFPDAEEIFCTGRVLFHGQPVGVIVAEKFDQAVQAAKQVKIIYEKVSDEPICPTIKAVLMNQTKERIFDQPINSRDGPEMDVQVSQKIVGTLELAGQFHYTMEPQTCLCVPSEDGMDVYAATQWIDLCQVVIAAALKVPQNTLNLTVRRLGGGFGSKLTRVNQLACACALAAYLTKRPVRFVMKIEANMGSFGKRYGCISNYQVDVDGKGKILKLSNQFMQDYGSNLNENVVDDAKIVFGLSYNSAAWKIEGKAVLTDSPSNTWMRAPATTEGISMIETIMEHIAWVTGTDPMQVRLSNMPAASVFQKLMPQFRQDVEFDKRKKTIDDFNAKNRWRKRGIAMVPMQYPLVHFGALHAQVSIYAKDGTVSISHGGIEVGQGINTKAAQVAAFTLGIPLEKISIKPTTSMTSPNAAMTGGSMTSEVVCLAVIKACEILNTRLQPIKNELKNAPWEKVTQTCYTRDIDLSVLYQYKKADLKPYSIWGLSCAEIEIDVLTGNIQLTRVDILEDTGESLSPGIDVGQIEGAYVMGIGYWLTESLIYDMTNGALLTNRSWNYKPPGAKDIPVDFRIRLIQTGDNPFGVLRSKATGEPAFTMAIGVVFALRYALRSAQKDAGRPDDWIPLGSASTPDQIFLKASNAFEQYKLK